TTQLAVPDLDQQTAVVIGFGGVDLPASLHRAREMAAVTHAHAASAASFYGCDEGRDNSCVILQDQPFARCVDCCLRGERRCASPLDIVKVPTRLVGR